MTNRKQLWKEVRRLAIMLAVASLVLSVKDHFYSQPDNPDDLIWERGSIVYRCVHDGLPIRWCDDTRNTAFSPKKDSSHMIVAANVRPGDAWLDRSYLIYDSRWFDSGWGTTGYIPSPILVELDANTNPYFPDSMISEEIEQFLRERSR